jgi:hypothetical protein|eukprot:COSAG06_NODE_6595_length_2862_cov_3.684763_2_plen_89_part_00
MQLAAAAGTGAAVASYAADRPLQASLFLAAVPLSVVAIYHHWLTAKTLEHMGSSGQQLSEMIASGDGGGGVPRVKELVADVVNNKKAA